MSNRKRDKLKIDPEVLYYILKPDLQEEEQEENKELQSELTKYRLVQTTIVVYDEYDGGASYDSIIEDLTTNKFYKTSYNTWDLNHQDSYGPYSDSVELEDELTEVFQEEVTIIVYV